MKNKKAELNPTWFAVILTLGILIFTVGAYYGYLTIIKYKEGVAYECEWIGTGAWKTQGCYNSYLSDFLFDKSYGDYIFWKWICYNLKDCSASSTEVALVQQGEGWTPLYTGRLYLGFSYKAMASCRLKYTPYKCTLKETCVPKTCSYYYDSAMCGTHIFEDKCEGYITCTWYCPSGYQCVNSRCRSTPDPCAGVSCPAYCSGNTRYYNGKCANGICQYSSEYCDYGCESGYCKEQIIPECTRDLTGTCLDGTTTTIAQCINGRLYYIKGAICPCPDGSYVFFDEVCPEEIPEEPEEEEEAPIEEELEEEIEEEEEKVSWFKSIINWISNLFKNIKWF